MHIYLARLKFLEHVTFSIQKIFKHHVQNQRVVQSAILIIEVVPLLRNIFGFLIAPLDSRAILIVLDY